MSYTPYFFDAKKYINILCKNIYIFARAINHIRRNNEKPTILHVVKWNEKSLNLYKKLALQLLKLKS